MLVPRRVYLVPPQDQKKAEQEVPEFQVWNSSSGPPPQTQNLPFCFFAMGFGVQQKQLPLRLFGAPGSEKGILIYILLF